MITLTINGEPHGAEPPLTLADVIAHRMGIRIAPDGSAPEGTALGIAAAVNAALVPRSTWATVVLAEGDAVEIVTATQGG
ncbi:MAG: sulfur carrier protein ThiS [Actinobacteria bacterium]|nr:sulfur carrier protein ThiS [Actinomycetota bacterium]